MEGKPVLETKGIVDQAEECVKSFEAGLEITQSIDGQKGKANVLWNLGIIYKIRGNLLAAPSLTEQAAQIAEQNGLSEATSYRIATEALRMRKAE